MLAKHAIGKAAGPLTIHLFGRAPFQLPEALASAGLAFRIAAQSNDTFDLELDLDAQGLEAFASVLLSWRRHRGHRMVISLLDGRIIEIGSLTLAELKAVCSAASYISATEIGFGELSAD